MVRVTPPEGKAGSGSWHTISYTQGRSRSNITWLDIAKWRLYIIDVEYVFILISAPERPSDDPRSWPAVLPPRAYPILLHRTQTVESQSTVCTSDKQLNHGVKPKSHVCEGCGRGFEARKDLARHYLIHTGERPYKCEACGAAFNRKTNLTRHMKHCRLTL